MAKRTSPKPPERDEEATENALLALKVARRLANEISQDIGDEVDGMKVGMIGTQGQLPLFSRQGEIIGLVAIQVMGSPLITRAILVDAIDHTAEMVETTGVSALTAASKRVTAEVIPLRDDQHNCDALKCHPGQTCEGLVIN